MENQTMSRDLSKPEPGYYYHYKHDPKGALNNYAYEVLCVTHHTEDDCRPEDQFTVTYRPLYESYVYKLGKVSDGRPYDMFMSEAVIDGVPRARFTKITDPVMIAELHRIRESMYPSWY